MSIPRITMTSLDGAGQEQTVEFTGAADLGDILRYFSVFLQAMSFAPMELEVKEDEDDSILQDIINQVDLSYRSEGEEYNWQQQDPSMVAYVDIKTPYSAWPQGSQEQTEDEDRAVKTSAVPRYP
jgi:hypothetical protein